MNKKETFYGKKGGGLGAHQKKVRSNTILMKEHTKGKREGTTFCRRQGVDEKKRGEVRHIFQKKEEPGE